MDHGIGRPAECQARTDGVLQRLECQKSPGRAAAVQQFHHGLTGTKGKMAPIGAEGGEGTAAWKSQTEDLDEAAAIAIDGMLALLGREHGLQRREALALASVVVDLRVTQLVNGSRGIHARIAHDALR